MRSRQETFTCSAGEQHLSVNLNELSTTALLFQCLMLQVEKIFHSYEYYRSDYLIQTENITKDLKEKDERENMAIHRRKKCVLFGFYIDRILAT